MIARQAALLKLLKTTTQFVIPIYQRNYSWTEAQCRQLWNDLLKVGRNEKLQAHFIGSIVYVEKGLSNRTSQEAMLIIDGQQRLTTCTLLLLALSQHLEANQVPELLEQFSAKKIRNYYLVNPEEEGERYYKLLLSESDKETLISLMAGRPLPFEPSYLIQSNFGLFKSLIQERGDELEVICKGLTKLVIVDISLDRDQDNPQLIFESMNSTGLALSQADLIRNFILMGLEPTLQSELYRGYWRPMERAFGQAAYTTHFDVFMRDFLTAKTGSIPRIGDVYTEFKRYTQESALEVRGLVADIHRFAQFYCAIVLTQETTPVLAAAFHDLRELDVKVAYPTLLAVYDDFKNDLLSLADFVRIVRLIESYMFRRAVCNIPTNSMNKMFARFHSQIDKSRYLESVEYLFSRLPSYRRFPVDNEFQRAFVSKDLYNPRLRSYWLRRMENHGRRERVAVENYTIEHILPQNPELSSAWIEMLGPDWKAIQDKYLHTPGNLTLTGYNSQYSDRPFEYKRNGVQDAAGSPVGFAHSPLRLNAGLGTLERWDEAAILARAQRLATEAEEIWPAVRTTLEFKAEATDPPSAKTFTIADHPPISTGPMQDLFEKLRSDVCSLDACVSVEFLKQYVAFKAETNFVDIIPQVKALVLSINLRIHEVEDPRGLCTDVAGKGHWANGFIELRLATASELPYALGIIRQAFEKQMGNNLDS
ncbi:MAG: DUF262 domain-containing protein [Fibrobacteres bacterium]|nr:DUF262 domain-containing protein [Fibrobacterota bacterium]